MNGTFPCCPASPRFFSSCPDGTPVRRWGCSISIPIQLTQGDVHDHCLSRHQPRQERICPARCQCHRPGVSGAPELAALSVAGVDNERSLHALLSSGSAAPRGAVNAGCGFAVRALFSLSITGFVCVGRMFLILLGWVSE